MASARPVTPCHAGGRAVTADGVPVRQRWAAYYHGGVATLNILLTGATGLIGGELARRLTDAGHAVTALVHRTTEVRGTDGALVPVAGTVRGDVAAERFGWNVAEHRSVARAHDLVIHCAASVRFDLPDAEYARINVGGTGEAVALARAGGCDLLHVSTAYVCGRTHGAVTEGPVAPNAAFANGYERGKAAAEAVVADSGLRWAIARPSIVMGEHGSGAIRQFDAIYAVVRLMARGRLRHLPAAPGATLDLVPIDHVVGGLLDLAERMAAAVGTVTHLTAATPTPLTALRDALARRPHLTAPTLLPPAGFEHALSERERRVWGASVAAYAPYFAHAPRFQAERLAALSGRRCPPTDAAYLDRLIDFAVAKGFLPAA